MATKMMRYTLDNINQTLFDGFDYKLSEKTLEIISSLSLQVGSPDYVKTPNFQKRENPMKIEPKRNIGAGGGGGEGGYSGRNKRGKAIEITSDEDWNLIKTNTKVEEKDAFTTQIDSIRVYLNKITDKNYIDMRNKIIELIDKLIIENITAENLSILSYIIFDIASTNRYYSKIYADLYSDLSKKYEVIKTTFEKNLEKFTDLFNNIEYVDPDTNYDKFCEINKVNEKRKALASFYFNLMTNSIISKTQIKDIVKILLTQIYTFILVDDKKSEVDELTETIIILYKKELYENDYSKEIEGLTINEIVHKIANSKVKDYKSLTQKSLFKFMDLIDM